MSFLINMVVFLFVLGLVIMIHEFGHFIMAKRANILCHEFSLGMGPVLYSKRKGETLFSIRAIPFGGYVMMAGEEMEKEIVKPGDKVRIITNNLDVVTKIILDVDNDEYEKYELITVEKIDLKGNEDEMLYINDYEVIRDAFFVFKNRELQIAPHNRSFENKTKMQRFLSIFAGPFMNFALAFVLFIVVGLLSGFPIMDKSTIGSTNETLPAYGQILPGDKIVEINDFPVSNWDDIKNVLDENPTDRLIKFDILRDGEEVTVTITPVVYFYTIGIHSDEGAVNELRVGDVVKDSPSLGLLEQGDIITHVNGVSVITWFDFANELKKDNDGSTVDITVLRDEVEVEVTIIAFSEKYVQTAGYEMVLSKVGIAPDFEFDFGKSLLGGFVGVKNSSTLIFDTIALLFNDDSTNVSQLSGVVGIFDITSRALQNGFVSLLGWMALLSVNLGVINLLPIPALDGGRLVFLGYEAVTRRKPNRKIENTLHYIMYILLMGLFVYITFYDLQRLFNIK
ncbi:RIP metalloprotease RseP [Candidatus Izimaplasma bacterium ZiA1]|uniref:RIP metalloprotease RseP n=1 Tax=Candidatus Izimoplasma sp. ZiA1 TaxID=2024899 RepID=UPI000BAA8E4B|nr:RIP metalloprotease RseP [Candidatus Izimaplasma bacterium ZiA1]